MSLLHSDGAHERTEFLGWIADGEGALDREPFHGDGVFDFPESGRCRTGAAIQICRSVNHYSRY
jgi:hypothetical protein